MKNAWIVFRKELKDTLRDRRTLLMAVVVPLVAFPVIMYLMTKLSAAQEEEAQEKVLQVGLVRHGNAAGFAEHIKGRSDLRVHEDIPPDSARALVRRDSLDAIFMFGENFDQQVAAERPGMLSLVFKTGSDTRIQQRRLNKLVETYRQDLMDQRLARLNLDRSAIETIRLNEVDVATSREAIGQLVGGFLPYIFLIFCFMGCMYPAIDLGAGEKERATMETLLTAPTARFQIALGKFGVVTLAGLASALIAIIGLYVGMQLMGELPGEVTQAAESVLQAEVVLLLASLLLPLTMFFAGVELILSLYAKSFKEAQSILSPLSILVILPAALGLLPGMELTAGTALVPVLNVSLATKDILSGTIDAGLLFLVYASLVVLAGISLYGCTFFFRKESVIFRA